MKALTRTLLLLAGLVASGVAIHRIYRSHLRTWMLTWGATPAEATDSLPGDDLLEAADIVATRAIEIDAPPCDKLECDRLLPARGQFPPAL